MSTELRPESACRPELFRPFGALASPSLERLRDLLRHRCVPRGTIVFHQGEPPDGIYLVRSGVLSLEHVTPSGRLVTVRLAAGTEIVALAETLTGDRHQFLARALADSRLDFAPRDRFLQFLGDEPGLAFDLLRRIARRVERLQRGCYEVTGRYPLTDRLLGKLQDLADTCGVPTDDGVLLDLPLTVQHLANLLGCSRQWTSKLLGDLEETGAIRRRQRRIVLRDTEGQASDLSPG